MRKPSSLEIAHAAVREVDALRRKFLAERAVIHAAILARDGEPIDQLGDGPSFESRVRERINGHGSIIKSLPVERVSLARLHRDLSEVDFILNRVLVNDELAKRAALKAEYDLDHADEWADDLRTLAAALLQIKKLARVMIGKAAATLEATGLPRGQPLDGDLPRFLEVEGLHYQVLQGLVMAGIISARDVEEADQCR